MSTVTATTAGTPEGSRPTSQSFSLVRGGPPFDLQRRLRLIPSGGLGIARRALLFAALAWAPMTFLALLAGRLFPGEVSEPLLQHFAVHVRCLVAIPLLIAGDAFAERTMPSTVAHFLRSGVVSQRNAAAFAGALAAAARVRDSVAGAVMVLALVAISGMGFMQSGRIQDESSWALAPDGGLLAAGWWYVLVARPLFALLVGLWLWRLVVVWVLCRRLAKLELELVPMHPDAAGGLGFLDRVPIVFLPAVAALSSVLAGVLAHEVLFHGVELRDSLRMLGVWVVLVVALPVSPLLAFTPKLAQLRWTALRDYGALLARHGRLVDRRWIREEPIPDDPLLRAPEIGPIADTLALHEAVEALRPVPFGTRTLVPLALAALVPILPVVALEIPLQAILLRLAGIIL